MILNELISASAGTGKTYRLTTRFLFWLLHGGDPTRAIALTFSKKAAGEFLDRILTRLSEAAADAKSCKDLVGEFQKANYRIPENAPTITQQHCLRTLQKLVAQIHAIRLGTIDSFFHQILSTFGNEFGLPGKFRMLDEYAKSQAQNDAISQLIGQSGEEFLEQYQTAQSERLSKNVNRSLLKWAKDISQVWRQAPHFELWGKAPAIWGMDAPPFAKLSEEQREQHLHTLRNSEFEKKVTQNAVDSLLKFLHSPIGKSQNENKFREQILQNLDVYKSGTGNHQYGKSVFPIPATTSTAIGHLMEDRLRSEIELRMTRTQGVAKLLQQYEHFYTQHVRSKGSLTFEDFPLLLDPESEGTPMLSNKPTDLERLQMDYRFDGQFDQWFLDEFQDTSNPQWRILQNLAEETLYDDQDKALFLVGDPKQAIYGWRGGDHTLFDRIEGKYWETGKQEEELFRKDTLDHSYRSTEPVLELVNNLFSNTPILSNFDNLAARQWEHAWSNHKSAGPVKNQPGISQVLVVREDSEDEEEHPELAATLGLLEEIQPLENRRSCAIIVPSNRDIRTTVEYIRAQGSPDLKISGDASYSAGFDNPLASLLISLLKAAIHPEDTLSRKHLSISLLAGKTMDSETGRLLPEVRNSLLEDLQIRGFEYTLDLWTQKVLSLLQEDSSFIRERAKELLKICRDFDKTGSHDIDEFLEFAAAYEAREPDSGGTIKVMTVHRSKGLTFDMTIAVRLEGREALNKADTALPYIHQESGKPDWVLQLPAKEYCQGVPAFRQALEDLKTSACYENFCNLYVALTRAKYGSYVILKAPGKTTQAANAFLFQVLNEDEYEHICKRKDDAPLTTLETLAEFEGIRAEEAPKWKNKTDHLWTSSSSKTDRFWYQQLPEPKTSQAEDKPVIPSKSSSAKSFPKISTKAPSTHDQVLKGEWLFPKSIENTAADFGTEIHALFEQMEWLPQDADIQTYPLSTEHTYAESYFRECLSHPEPRSLMTHPGSKTEVWREKRFFHLLKDKKGKPESFYSGVIDRVVLHLDLLGEVIAADIIDFKTDRLEEHELQEALERHSEQLQLYRRILSEILVIPESQITAKLLMCHCKKVVEVV